MPRKRWCRAAPAYGRPQHARRSGGGRAHALKRTLERYKLPARAVSFGPAEEQLISRPFWCAPDIQGRDAAILIHIGDNMRTTFGFRNYAANQRQVHLPRQDGARRGGAVGGQGRARCSRAHEHRLRQAARTSQADYRGHRVITMAASSPTYSGPRADLVVRARRLGPARRKISTSSSHRQGRGADDRTTMDMEFVASAWPQLANKAIAEAIQKNIDAVGLPKWSDDRREIRPGFPDIAWIEARGLNTQPVKFGAPQQSFRPTTAGT